MCNMFFSDRSITTKSLLLSSCYIPLLTIQNQHIIQEEAIEGRDTSPHSSNFIQDWISKLCYLFLTSRSSSRRQLHFF